MRAGAVHHVAILVHDLGRSEAFYAGVLGMPVRIRHTDDAGNPRSVWLDLSDGAFLAIEKGDGERPALRGWHCVALSIARADREAWRTLLEARGFPIERETAFTLYARDPDGALVALSHYPDPA
jgi:glyoxylase I family protein